MICHEGLKERQEDQKITTGARGTQGKAFNIFIPVHPVCPEYC